MTPWHSPQTLTAPQTQTRGKTLLFCHTSQNHQFRGPLNLKKWPRGPQNLENGPLASFFLKTLPQMIENTVQKKKELEISKNTHFSRCVIFLGEERSTFLNNDVSNNMHFWSIHSLISMIFVNSNFYFLHWKREAQTKKIARNLAPASKFRTPRPPKGLHSDRKRGHSGFWVTQVPQCKPPTLYSSPVSSKQFSSSMISTWISSLFCKYLPILVMSTRSRAVHGVFASSFTSAGG